MLPRRSLLFLLPLLLSAYRCTAEDHFTPLTAHALTANTRPFEGTDGRLHLVYELVLTNTNATPATLNRIQVLDSSSPEKVLVSFAGQDMVNRLRMANGRPVDNATVEFSSMRLFLIDLSLNRTANVPKVLLHRIDLRGGGSPAPQPQEPVAMSYIVAPLPLLQSLPVITPPLAGKHWVAVNGCCEPSFVHRGTALSVNGGIHFAQRFAIDWMQLDAQGQFVHGDPADVHNYTSYGADVLAVADGTVVDKLNILDDQKPGSLPDPKTITIENVDGNHVVLDLGNGVHAFYAHMQKGSIPVEVGTRVKRGQVLGKLGNTGNTSAPHLHFQLMEGTSVLGSNGIPYEIRAFEFAGQVSASEFAGAPGVEGSWSKGLLSAPNPRQDQFPLDLNIVNFTPQR